MVIVYKDITGYFQINQVSENIVSHMSFLLMLQQNVLCRNEGIKHKKKKTGSRKLAYKEWRGGSWKAELERKLKGFMRDASKRTTAIPFLMCLYWKEVQNSVSL